MNHYYDLIVWKKIYLSQEECHFNLTNLPESTCEKIEWLGHRFSIFHVDSSIEQIWQKPVYYLYQRHEHDMHLPTLVIDIPFFLKVSVCRRVEKYYTFSQNFTRLFLNGEELNRYGCYWKFAPNTSLYPQFSGLASKIILQVLY